jgi:hypothetical protein
VTIYISPIDPSQCRRLIYRHYCLYTCYRHDILLTWCSIFRNHNPVLSSFKRRVIHVERDCLPFKEHRSSAMDFSGVHVARSLVFYVIFFCPFSLGHCMVCPSSIYGCWLLLWYLQVFFDGIQQSISHFIVTFPYLVQNRHHHHHHHHHQHHFI